MKVSGNCDTGKTYITGCIAFSVLEKIKLQRRKWYTVEGLGNLTINPVTLRIK